MLKSYLSLALSVLLLLSAVGSSVEARGHKQTQQPGQPGSPPSQTKQAGQVEKPPTQSQPPRSQQQVRSILPSEFNVRIEPDQRTLIVMAAINMAGFDAEGGGQPLTPARFEIRKDLANLDPQLKQRLAAFYKSHRREDVDEIADAMRYAALSLMMTEPPSFEVYVPQEVLPADLRSLLERDGKRSSELPALISEFYVKSGIKQLLPKYTAVAHAYAAAYEQPVSLAIQGVLNYFHTTPDTIVNMRPLVIESGDAGDRGGKTKQKIFTRTRTRQVFIIPDPFSAYGGSFVRDDLLNQKDDLLSRKIGDDYIVLVGPSRTANTEAIVQAMIRFAIDPIVERHLRASLEYKDQIVALVARVPTAAKQFGSSVYLVIRESLARAAEARLRRIRAQEGGNPYTEDDSVHDLAQAYLRGAVLAFHIYDGLTGLEKVGISIEDYFDQMIATVKFDREAERPGEFEATVARVAAKRAAAAKAPPADPEGALDPVTRKIIQSSDLIRQRRFSEAKPLLEQALEAAPTNARALFGMAQVVSQIPSAIEQDPKKDEDDKIQAQYDRFKQAVKLFRAAIDAASPDAERWLVQWSHVFIGRILDFQDFRADAVEEYQKAVALGDVPNGAYKEAQEGKQRPYRKQ